MEFLLQYLDDLDDFAGAIALIAERMRRLAKALILTAVTIGFQLFAVVLAWTQPPLALGFISLLAVWTLYRAVVNQPPRAVSTR
ncbi:MAG: hypothetical protein WD795_07490 [Woeseia sp.]